MRSVITTILLVSVASLVGCATNGRDRVYRNMGLAAVTGVAVGQSQENYKGTYSTMYAGIGAAVAAAVTLYLDDPYNESEQVKAQMKALSAKFDQFENGKVVSQGPATFGARVPEKYRALINPGEWRVYEIDQWVEDGENRMIHQDKMMEMVPPTLVPGRQK